MSNNKTNKQERLTQLRGKIDAVDESIHNLLMQRATVIDELIQVKGAAIQTGAAFRPGREAVMMEILADRHNGSIPLEMIIHIWRDIISTFTHLQAPYTVHIAREGNAETIRDMARFQFGFSVPLDTHDNIADVLEAVAKSGNALAVLPIEVAECWWSALGSDSNLTVMARLPVADLSMMPCDALVIAPPLSDPVPFDWRLYKGTLSSTNGLADWNGGEVLATGVDEAGKELALIAIDEIGKTPANLLDIHAVGGYFSRAKQSD